MFIEPFENSTHIDILNVVVFKFICYKSTTEVFTCNKNIILTLQSKFKDFCFSVLDNHTLASWDIKTNSFEVTHH